MKFIENNTYTLPSKRLLDTSLDEHSERHNKGNCVKQAWRGIRESKRNWGGDV